MADSGRHLRHTQMNSVSRVRSRQCLGEDLGLKAPALRKAMNADPIQTYSSVGLPPVELTARWKVTKFMMKIPSCSQ